MSVNWQYQYGGHGRCGAQRVYRDNELGVQCEIITRRRTNGEWLRGESFFFIDGCDLEFRDEADMLKHLDAQGKGEVRCVCGRVISKKEESE